jgi:uncharacterized CHY-type Zn-finger protein
MGEDLITVSRGKCLHLYYVCFRCEGNLAIRTMTHESKPPDGTESSDSLRLITTSPCRDPFK